MKLALMGAGGAMIALRQQDGRVGLAAGKHDPDRPSTAGDEELWLEEVRVRTNADLDGKTLVESNLQRSLGVNFLALRRRNKQNVETESIADTRLEAGDVLIALGTRVQLDAMKHVC